MVFHTPQRRVNYPTLKLNNVNIERVSQFNFLGVILASSLKWDKHVAHVSLKISRVIGVLHVWTETCFSSRGVINSI